MQADLLGLLEVGAAGLARLRRQPSRARVGMLVWPSDRLPELAVPDLLSTAPTWLVWSVHGQADARMLASWFRQAEQALLEGQTPAQWARQFRRQTEAEGVSVLCIGQGTSALSPALNALSLPAQTDQLRSMTVLALDLVGSTRHLDEWGEEVYAGKLAQFHQLCQQHLLAAGGRPDAPQGDDGLMCYFGAPWGRAEGAVRAVQAALDLLPAVCALGWQLRIGIAQGRVALAQGQPVGMAIHLAARVQSLAPPDTVLVTDEVLSLLGAGFLTQEFAREVRAKGVAHHLCLHQVLGRAMSRGVRAEGFTAWTGRDQVLASLKQAWSQAQAGAGQAWTIEGAVGMGKTRLMREFAIWLHDQKVRWMQASGLAAQRDEPFGLLGRLLLDGLGVDVTTPKELLSLRLQAWSDERMQGAHGQRLLRWLTGLLRGDGGVAPVQPVRDALWLQWLMQWVWDVARQRPLCLLIDQGQWADAPSLHWLAQMAQHIESHAVMLVWSARPQPIWREAFFRAHPLVLQGLSWEASQALLLACGGSQLPQPNQAALLSAAGGVPLHVEALAQAALAGQWCSAADTPVPVKLQDAWQSQLQDLGEHVLALQWAAALWAVWTPAQWSRLAHIMGASEAYIQQASADALTAGLLRLDAGAPGYSFCSPLLQQLLLQSVWQRDLQHWRLLAQRHGLTNEPAGPRSGAILPGQG